MAKVYIVTSGSYSDYHINAVFSTEELAQGYIDRWGTSDYDIEEWDLDNPNPFERVGKDYYYVAIRKDGDILDGAKKMPPSAQDESIIPAVYGTTMPWMVVYCWATDEKHAIKIANEKRTQAIAEGKL